MAWSLVQSTGCFPWAVSSGSKIHSKQSGNYYTKRAAIHYKVMCSSLQTPPMRLRTFSGLRGGVNNSLCNMVNNKSHDFHLTVAAATSEKASPILPKGEDMFETFTDRANEVIKSAQKMTRRASYKFVGPEMILLALIGNDIDRIFGESADIAAKVLYSMDIYLEYALSEVKGRFGYGRISPPVEIPFTPSVLRVFELSLAEAQQLGHNYIGSEHLLLGLLGDEDANLVLRELGACPINIRTQVMRMIEESAAEVVGDGSSGNEMPTLEEEEEEEEEEYGLNLTELADEKRLDPVVQDPTQRIADFVGDGSSGNEMPTLEEEEYGLNLTELADEKNLDPVVQGPAQRIADFVGDGSSGNEMPTLEEEEEEGYGLNLTDETKLHPVVERNPLINTVIEIMGRLSKNVPCLVGEDGVGKRSIVKGLAQRIADFDVPDFLSNKKVITLDRCQLGKGGLEKLMEEIKESNGSILFINGYCTLTTEAAIDAANILIPAIDAIDRGELQCVVATTPGEYLKLMKNNPVLERVFQPIKVPEATVDETLEILKGIREQYENYHEVRYTDEALVAAAHISDQTMVSPFSWRPGKAIFLIDQAGASFSREEEKVGLSYPMRLMTKELFGVFRNKDLEQASVVLDQETGYKIDMSSSGSSVTKADIEDTISVLHTMLNLFNNYDSSCQEI